MKIYYIYILHCADGSYYTGISSNLDKRLEEHHSGFYRSCYTYSRRPLILRYTEAYQFVNQAIAREKQIKGWTRQKKEALINGNTEKLRILAISNKEKAK